MPPPSDSKAGRGGRRTVLRGWLTMGIYQPLFFLAFLLYSPVLAWRALWDRRYRAGLRQRLGAVPPTDRGRDVVWIHGVSVGEVKAARDFIALLRERRPDLQLVISSTTPTGQLVARQEHPDLRVVFYPLDLGPCPGRSIDRIRPCCVLLMELEIWPNFLQAAHRRGIPVAVINGRISARTFRGYRLARGLLPQLDLISTYCVQDDSYRQRLLELGVGEDRVHVTGNMKYDSVMAVDTSGGGEGVRRWLAAGGRLVLVAGSTHADEEMQVLEATRAAVARSGRPVRLVLVPRHPERAGSVCDQLEAAGATPIRWSKTADAPEALGEEDVLVVDRIGLLQGFYAAADLAFVGGSLIPHGGQNMLEPAALGLPTLFGPHTDNFRRDVEFLLAAAGAVRVEGKAELGEELAALCGDPDRRATLGANARGVIARNQGATVRTLELVGGLLGPRGAGLPPSRNGA